MYILVVAEEILAEDCKSIKTEFDVHCREESSVVAGVVDVVLVKAVLANDGLDCCGLNKGPW